VSFWLSPIKGIKTFCACAGIVVCVWYGFEIAPFIERLSNNGSAPFTIGGDMHLVVISLCLSPSVYAVCTRAHASRPVRWLAGIVLVAMIGYLTYLAVITLIVLMLGCAKTL